VISIVYLSVFLA